MRRGEDCVVAALRSLRRARGVRRRRPPPSASADVEQLFVHHQSGRLAAACARRTFTTSFKSSISKTRQPIENGDGQLFAGKPNRVPTGRSQDVGRLDVRAGGGHVSREVEFRRRWTRGQWRFGFGATRCTRWSGSTGCRTYSTRGPHKTP